MDLLEAKAAARKRALADRKATHQAGIDQKAFASALIAALGKPRGQVMAGYMPIRTEIDPLPAMAMLSQDNRIAVPVIEATGGPLKFRAWHPGCAMVDGPFGAKIPQSGDWLDPDILLVPLVAFDRRGTRLGYGGGFYDRTLERLRACRPTFAVGLAYAVQEQDALPFEPTDQPLDLIVTERGAVTPTQ